jgi:predicted nucleotidyltransferase
MRPGTRVEPTAGLVEAIAEVAAGEPAVAAAYLFGSQATGRATPLSDIDVGLLIDHDAGREAVVGTVTDALCRRLRTGRMDVVSLTEASLPLRYRVVRDGVRVFRRDAAATERFEAETVLQYLDFKPLRDAAFTVMRRAILERH